METLEEIAQILTRNGYTVLKEMPVTSNQLLAIGGRTWDLLSKIYDEPADDRLTQKDFHSNIEGDDRLSVLEFIRDFQRYPEVFRNYRGFGKKSIREVEEFIEEFRMRMIPDPSLFNWHFLDKTMKCEVDDFEFYLSLGEGEQLLTWQYYDVDYCEIFDSGETLAEIEFYIKKNILCYA